MISFDWFPVQNASFTILVKILDSDMLVLLNYVTQQDSRCVWNDSVSFAGAEQVPKFPRAIPYLQRVDFKC